MKFTKMQGIGNDYVYVNCFKEKVDDPKTLAQRVSDRHYGVGSDGLILIKPSDCADFEMDMYNADGSRSAMCGNGIRCVAKYVYDYGLTDKTQISVLTGSGIKYLDLTVEDGRVTLVKVNMGSPILEAERIPADIAQFGNKQPEEHEAWARLERSSGYEAAVKQDSEKDLYIISRDLSVNGRTYQATCVSMGNPHCVVCVDDVKGLVIEEIGPHFENHVAFPERVNTEFIRVLDRKTVQMRVWERGSGETWACGTGACAVAVACILNGWTEDEVTVKLRGGDLKIRWDRGTDTVYMTGPATTVFDGELF